MPGTFFIVAGRNRLQWADPALHGQLDWTGPTAWPRLALPTGAARPVPEPRQSGTAAVRQHLIGDLSPEDCDAYLARRQSAGVYRRASRSAAARWRVEVRPCVPAPGEGDRFARHHHGQERDRADLKSTGLLRFVRAHRVQGPQSAVRLPVAEPALSQELSVGARPLPPHHLGVTDSVQRGVRTRPAPRAHRCCVVLERPPIR
jgi:hypothetical protein